MDYLNTLAKYPSIPTVNDVEKALEKARAESVKNLNKEVYALCYSAIDLTQLNVTDSVSHIKSFTTKVVEFPRHFPSIANVASICVHPNFVETVGIAIGDDNMAITSVAGGFPSSQTFLEVKMLEMAMAIENGADEIDVVINVGQMIEGDYDAMASDVEILCREAHESDVIFKVIIESGALKTPELIYKASILSMATGTDFIKTSTGKIDVAATPEAAYVMCKAIRDYYDTTGRKVGFKAAGGIKTAEDAALYYTIIENVLGKEWLTPKLFRIGASSAANNILSSIVGKEVKYY